MVKIKDIAVVSSGSFIKSSPDTCIKYLQSRHFDSAGRYLDNAFDDIASSNKKEKYLLQDNDILFSSKGMVNFATLYIVIFRCMVRN